MSATPPRTGARRLVTTTLPTEHGTFVMHGYAGGGGLGNVALVMGDVAAEEDLAPLVRVHSECLTGDALGSYRCDCGEQLDAALHEISLAGRGALVYLRGHEGRGIGLLAKLEAYALQDAGVDTVDANLRLGYPADARTYDEAAEILHDLGVRRVRLMSANPDKAAKLAELGIEVVARHRLPVVDRPENSFYLTTKRHRMGHDAAAPPVWGELVAGRVPDVAPTPDDAALLDRYGPLVALGRPATIAQLGQSSDGFIAARTGDAEFVTGPADREHLHRLRALVDAVVVGAGTVVADDPRLTVRAVPGADPVRVVLDPAARVPADARVLTDGAAPTLWCLGPAAGVPATAAHVQVVRLPLTAGRFDPADVLGELHARGLGRVLVEGGGRTVSQFLAARLLDRLFLTIAPVLIGDGVPGIRFTGSDRMADALTAPTRRFVLGPDVCTEFDLTAVRRP
ncbi:GTP cyclohydrolase II [Georgenia sp. TF02-10]|uniref:GTP cyclohydrolase II n=1 Tax=Georgenia sp. TF02-10 TaxID=2917725 RepID=UPI001FA6BF48|nr:GTP cyclohydrolase II [Georgenia sp. TF02-10]UNX55209.1 GTP cyclohydrolase II [Georgenia sp. TF02-10]